MPICAHILMLPKYHFALLQFADIGEIINDFGETQQHMVVIVVQSSVLSPAYLPLVPTIAQR